MKAAIIRKFGAIEVTDLPEPRMGDYDALCELLYGATCTGTDSHIIEGVFPWISPLPTVPGHESVGRVVAVGAKVRHFRIGDLITRVGTPACPQQKFSVTWGGFAEMGLAKDHRAMKDDGLPEAQWKGSTVNQVVPADVDPAAAPMFITWRETLSYLKRLGFRAGQSLLVIGSGGNGLSFAAHGVNMEGSCVAMAGASRLEDAAKLKAGVKHYFDYQKDNLAQTINAAVPEGFDYIIDAVGKKGVADRLLPCLKPGGTLAIYGIDDFGAVSLSPSRARGRFSVQYAGDYDEAETHLQVCDFVQQGKLDASLWYDQTRAYPLAEISQAFADLKARKLSTPKALIRLRA